MFAKDFKMGKWYGANPDLFLEATYYLTKQKGNFDIWNFIYNFYEIQINSERKRVFTANNNKNT